MAEKSWTDEEAFALARRLCDAQGADPDAPIYQGHGQVGEGWMVYLPAATEALIALKTPSPLVAEMKTALQQIAWLRPAGATPKMVPGSLIEKAEKIALAALAKSEASS